MAVSRWNAAASSQRRRTEAVALGLIPACSAIIVCADIRSGWDKRREKTRREYKGTGSRGVPSSNEVVCYNRMIFWLYIEGIVVCTYLTAAEVGVGHGVARVLAHGQDEVQPRALILALQHNTTPGQGSQGLLARRLSGFARRQGRQG